MKLEVRKAVLSDCRGLYNWRVDKKNSEYSRRGTDIKYSDYRRDYETALADDSDLMLIVSFDGKPCCFVRFAGDINDREVSIYMAPGFHGFGLGLQCLLLAERYLKEQLQGLPCNLTAEIMNDNTASIKMFTRAGYIYSMADWYKLI